MEALRAEGTRIWEPDEGERSSTVFVVRDCLEPLEGNLRSGPLPLLLFPRLSSTPFPGVELPLLIAPGCESGCPASVGAAAALLLASTIEGSADMLVGGRAVAMRAIRPMPG